MKKITNFKTMLEIRKDDPNFPKTIHELAILILRNERLKKLNKLKWIEENNSEE